MADATYETVAGLTSYPRHLATQPAWRALEALPAGLITPFAFALSVLAYFLRLTTLPGNPWRNVACALCLRVRVHGSSKLEA